MVFQTYGIHSMMIVLYYQTKTSLVFGVDGGIKPKISYSRDKRPY